MGMSASQARFLMLTARKSDIEYQVQQINQERILLSNNMESAIAEYTDKINNTVLVYKSIEKNANCTLTYDAITSSIADGGMGLVIVNSAGKIVVASEDELEGKTEEECKMYWVDGNVKDYDFLEKNLQNGNLFLASYNPNNTEEPITEYSIDGSNEVVEVADTSDDAAAQAKYETSMTSLQRKDKMLELQLSQLETEHQAIQTEIDSIKDVINKNVESSFKTFGGS